MGLQQLLDHSGMPPASYLGLKSFSTPEPCWMPAHKAAPATILERACAPALDAMGEIRYGTMHLRFTPPRSGSSYVGLTMIDASGHFRE
jgi:hypothetical protein